MRIPLALVLLAVGGRAPGAGGANGGGFYDGWGPVVVTTVITAAGKAFTPPTNAQPTYYRGSSLGRSLGSIPGDTEPEPKELARFVAGILAQQGYVAAAPGQHDPALFLVVQWGYLRRGEDDLLWFLGCDPTMDYAGTDQAGLFQRNLHSRAVETIMNDARSAIYGLVLTAYDPKTVHSPRPVAYWQTRVGLPANGKSMAQALPVMVASAGPAIGHPAEEPALFDTDNARAGRVTLGELRFIDYLNEVPPPGTRSVHQGTLNLPREINPSPARSKLP